MDRIKLTKDYKLQLYDLMSPIDIDKDFTLGNLCRILVNFDELVTLCDIVQCSLHSFISECLDLEKEADSDLHYLRLTWECVYDNDKNDPWSNLSLHVDAVGETWDDHQPGGPFYKEGEDHSRYNNWAISFLPLYKIRDLPIKVNPKMLVYQQLHLEGNSIPAPDITLLSLIYWLFWEFSFYGVPKERNEIHADLEKTVQEIKREDLEL